MRPGSSIAEAGRMNIFMAILACEIAFWVVLFAGLVVRYLFRRRALSTALLLCVPLLDLALLALIAWDMLVNRVAADFTHGLGAVYLGFTVAFGHRVISSVDAWFAHRFAGGPEPREVPRHGRERIAHEWKDWGRMVLCAVIASAVLLGIIRIVDDLDRTQELLAWLARVWFITGVWLLGWPVWATVRGVTHPQPEDSDAAPGGDARRVGYPEAQSSRAAADRRS